MGDNIYEPFRKDDFGGYFLACSGYTSGTYVTTTGYRQEASNGYCHKKIEPVGPSDLTRPTHIGEGDYIDHYGPCDEPTMAELIHEQKRFERVRFERDFGDEGESSGTQFDNRGRSKRPRLFNRFAGSHRRSGN